MSVLPVLFSVQMIFLQIFFEFAQFCTSAGPEWNTRCEVERGQTVTSGPAGRIPGNPSGRPGRAHSLGLVSPARLAHYCTVHHVQPRPCESYLAKYLRLAPSPRLTRQHFPGIYLSAGREAEWRIIAGFSRAEMVKSRKPREANLSNKTC